MGFFLSLSFSHCYFGFFFPYSNYLTYWSVHFWLAPDFNICHFWPISLNVAMSSLSILWLSWIPQFLQTLQHHLLTLFQDSRLSFRDQMYVLRANGLLGVFFFFSLINWTAVNDCLVLGLNVLWSSRPRRHSSECQEIGTKSEMLVYCIGLYLSGLLHSV